MRQKAIHRSHLVTLAVLAAAAICARLMLEGPGGAGAGASTTLAGQLGRATGLVVEPANIFWTAGEPSPGFASAVGRSEVLFLARETTDAPADLYRAEVRLAPGPALIGLDGLRNLTSSPAGDEYLLEVAPPHAVVATRALGQVRSLTLFDLDGQALPRSADWSRLQRILARAEDLQRTGRAAGLGQLNLRFVHPPREVELQLLTTGDRPTVLVEWAGRRGERRLASVDPATGKTDSAELEVVADVRLPKRPVLWVVDTVRAIPWIGPGPIEWAEGRFFALKDLVRRWRYRLGDDEDDAALAAEAATPAVESLPLPTGLVVGAEEPPVPWPPPPIEPPVFERRKPGEGTWRPAVPAFARRLPGAPAAVYRTYIRTDVERPYVRVHLFAMDLRQLDLHMVAGHRDPKPTTGALGTGFIPREADLLPRVVAAFNGAFKTAHGAYGMMVRRSILLPPQDQAATVATLDGNRAVMGSWPSGMAIPPQMVSLRQNMDPLVEDGVVNPRKRYLWGFTLDNDISNMNTVRSGICMTAAGTLMYAWGEDLTGTTLGVAMNAAGCVYGMHLDMNPYHTAFIFYGFPDDVDLERPTFDYELPIKEQGFYPARYVNGAPKDFFFLALKDPSPGRGWDATGLAQPAPAFVPAVFNRAAAGARLVAVDAVRARARIFPGAVPAELAPAAAGIDPTAEDDLLLLELVLGPFDVSRGQLVRGAVVAALDDDRATLAIRLDGSLDLIPWAARGDGASPIDSAVQGAWLIREREPEAGRGEVLAVARGGDGWLLLGRGEWNALAAALVEAGAVTAIAFPADAPGARFLLRGEHGMNDLSGEPVPRRQAAQAALRLYAVPQHLGGIRLEAALGRTD